MQTKTPRFQLAHRGSVFKIYENRDSTRGISLLTLILLAVGAGLVGLEFEEALDGRLVLRRPLGRGIGRSSRHTWTVFRVEQ